jgi:hypothetical protein
LIRKAKATDTPRIAELVQEAYARSPAYAGLGSVDVNRVKRIIVQGIQRDGQMGEGGWIVRVADTLGKLEGFAAAYLTRVYDIGPADLLLAQDWMIYGSPRCEARDGVALLLAIEQWAEKNPKVLEHQPTAVDTIVEDWKRLCGFYERRGYAQVGAVFRRRFAR